MTNYCSVLKYILYTEIRIINIIFLLMAQAMQSLHGESYECTVYAPPYKRVECLEISYASFHSDKCYLVYEVLSFSQT